MAALIAVNIANLIGLRPRGVENVLQDLTDAPGAILFLTAALAVVIRRGRKRLERDHRHGGRGAGTGRVVVRHDPGAAPRGWLPQRHAAGQAARYHLRGMRQPGRVGSAVGNDGQTHARAVAPDRCAGFALAGFAILGVAASAHGQSVLAVGLVMAAYATIGLFALDPGARRLSWPGSGARREGLPGCRLIFLGIADAVIRIIVGIRCCDTGPTTA
jgi:hypothetical protein